MNTPLDDQLDEIFGKDDTSDATTSTETDGGNNEQDQITQQTEDSEEDLQNLFAQPKQTEDKTNKTVDKDTQPINNTKQPNNVSKDLMDKDGNVLAKGGAERRLYEENQRMKKDIQTFQTQTLPVMRQQFESLQKQLATAQQELASSKGVIEGLRANDLTSQEIQSGLDFIRSWKNNPTEVIKYLLTTAQNNGINVDIAGMQPSINTEVIRRMIDDKFQPFIQEREQAQKELENEQRVQEEYQNFITKYPDSVIHDKTLAYMLEKNPQLSPEVAYHELKYFYLQKGFDFSKPLEEIQKERQQQPVQPQGLPQAPMVNNTVVADKTQHKVASISDNYKDIIKLALQDAGL